MARKHKDPLNGSYEEILRMAKALNKDLPLLKTRFGITDVEYTKLSTFCADGEAINDLNKRTKEFARQVSEYIHSFYFAPEQELVFPVTSELGVKTPSTRHCGLVAFLRSLIRKIKGNRAQYNDALGKELGIVGVEINFDVENATPDIPGHVTHDDHIHFTIKKKNHSGQNLYGNLADNKGWRLLAYMGKTGYDLHEDFPDELTEWKFYTKYVLDGEEIGQPSPELFIPVKQQHQD